MPEEQKTPIIIDIPRYCNGVEEIIFNGHRIPLNMNIFTGLNLSYETISEEPKLDIHYQGIPLEYLPGYLK